MSKNTRTPLVWRTEQRMVNDLVPYEANPRTMSEKQLSDLKKSLQRFNLVEIPAIDTTGRIIAGHQRLKVLQLLGRGDEHVDVRVPNRELSDDEYQQYLLTSNAVTGDWDFEKLKSFEMDVLLDVGFDADELNKVWAEHLSVEQDDFEEDKEFVEIKEPKTKRGDLIELGHHRLICGDSTDPSVLKRLLGDERASMIYSDPPYNLKGGIDYNSGIGGKQNYGGDVQDDRTDDEYRTFLKQTMEASLGVTDKDAHIFYWCDQTYTGLVQDLYRKLDIDNKRVCLWIKNGHNPTPGVAFNKCYEPCVYGVKGKPYISKSFQAFNEVMNADIGNGNDLINDTLDHLDVWAIKRLSGNQYEHATSKPPELHQKAIRRCTKPGDIILDSFGGSGSTLIAAEQLKRKAFLVEMEPVFCDLIIKRYEQLTGTKAIIHHEEGTSTAKVPA